MPESAARSVVIPAKMTVDEARAQRSANASMVLAFLRILQGGLSRLDTLDGRK